MGKSVEREGFFGKYTEHFDDNGNKIGESGEMKGSTLHFPLFNEVGLKVKFPTKP